MVELQESSAIGGMDYHGPGSGRSEPMATYQEETEVPATPRELLWLIRQVMDVSGTIKRYGKPTQNFYWIPTKAKGLSMKKAKDALEQVRSMTAAKTKKAACGRKHDFDGPTPEEQRELDRKELTLTLIYDHLDRDNIDSDYRRELEALAAELEAELNEAASYYYPAMGSATCKASGSEYACDMAYGAEECGGGRPRYSEEFEDSYGPEVPYDPTFDPARVEVPSWGRPRRKGRLPARRLSITAQGSVSQAISNYAKRSIAQFFSSHGSLEEDDVVEFLGNTKFDENLQELLQGYINLVGEFL